MHQLPSPTHLALFYFHRYYEREFTLRNIEDVTQEIKFKHQEENGEGTIEVYTNGTLRQTFNRTLSQLALEPIRFLLPLDENNKKKLERLEYYVGRDNPGCHLLVNNQPHQEMASQPEPDEPPEF